MKSAFSIEAENIRPLKNTVFVTDLEHGIQKTSRGIIIPDDNGIDRGIRPRWCRVRSVGPDVYDLNEGDWVLVEHGRWTFGMDHNTGTEIVRFWKIEYPEAVLLVADSNPQTTTKVVFENKFSSIR